MFLYTLKTQNYFFLLDNFLKQVKRIRSEEDLLGESTSNLRITYTYSVFKVKLYVFIPLWRQHKSEELIINVDQKKLIIKGYLARYAVKKQVSVESLVNKYRPDLSSQDIVTVEGPKRNILNTIYIINFFSTFLALLSVLFIFDKGQGVNVPYYVMFVATSLLIAGGVIIYRSRYQEKLNKLLNI